MWRGNGCVSSKENRLVRTVHFMAYSNIDLSSNEQRPHSDLSSGKLSFKPRPEERVTKNLRKILTV